MIQFTDYDRITDILFYLSPTITLNFNVILSRKNKTGERMFFQYETEYGSKYIGTNTGRAIKRNMSFYFTFDNKNDFGNGFILKPQDVVMLITIIDNQLLPLIIGERRIYKIIDGNLVITGKYKPIDYIQSDYKYLRMEPIVCKYEDGTFKEGIRLTVNSEHEYADLDIDKFFGLYYLLKNTDMYSAACALTNYVKQPPYGTNIYAQRGLGGGAQIPEEDWNSDIQNNQTNKGQNNSFLDNVKRKE